MDQKPRCRFAPSPTGDLHVGGARTALFNYLFAKATNGTFVLRIEDTDLQRSTPAAVEAIFQGLSWLGIEPDEGPYFQTQRFDIYRQYAVRLLETGHAYQCTCSTEELSKHREEQLALKQNPGYSGKHRPSNFEPQPTALPTGQEDIPFVIRLRTPDTGKAIFEDLILGKIETSYAEIDDFVIMRSDGTPTYNYVVVVDDVEMQMTHIIRGNDHISNTPKQIAVYEALNAKIPLFAHVPMILGADKKKLSKRHAATSVIEYKKDGYLPDAFVNYLARLGWSHGDQEIFTRTELESVFCLDHVGKSSAVFDFSKLQWVNSEHIKMTPIPQLTELLCDELKSRGILGSAHGKEHCENIKLSENRRFQKLVENLVERSKTLIEMADKCGWYFATSYSLEYDNDAARKFLTKEISRPLEQLATRLSLYANVDDEISGRKELNETSIEAIFNDIITEHNIKLGKLAQPVRVALTGTSVSPPIFAVIEILGVDESIARIVKAISFIEGAT